MADPGLRLALLGSPLAEVDGAPLAVDTRKAVALLAFLAVEGGAHRRDTLAALLWPDADAARARAALRRTLSTLRRALGGGHLVVAGELASLDPTGVDLDVDRFRELAATGAVAELEAAVRLHRGPFLAGFGLRDSVAFDDWQSLVGDRLARELGTTLDRLADGLAESGAIAPAVTHARRRLELDPLHEPAHQRLMELLARSGERRAALAQYRECVRALHRELGVAPLESTTELYRAIREGTVAAPAAPVHVPAPPAAPPLVGREREWSELRRAYARARTDGRLVVLEGELGIGKTRLATELLGWAQGQGAVAAGVRASEHESGLAYAVLIDLLRSALRAGDEPRVTEAARREAARLLPALGPAAEGPLDEPGAEARFYDGLVEALVQATSGTEPAVLVVDDAHWADLASLDVLAYLARRLRGRPLLLVLTWRPEEVPAGHPARRAAADAQRDGAASTVRLGRLDRGDVERLAAGVGASPELVDRLYRESQGVPFFVAEYLEAGTDEREVPTGVRELLEARLAAASPLAGQVLAAGAVLGRGFDPEMVRAVAGRTEDEVAPALDELCARGILAEGDGPVYDFRHEQLRKVAYELIGHGRRRLLHGRAADSLAPRSRATGSAAAVAQHLRRAGRDAEAAEWYALAGDRARELHANAEAIAHFEEARSLGHPETARLQRALGDLQTLQGRYGEALVAYEAAAAFADDGERAELEHRIGLVHDRRGEWELADDAYAEALELAAGSQLELRARITADRSLVAHRRGRDGQARELAGAALALAGETGDERAAAQAHNILGMLAAAVRAHDDARRELERSLALAEASDDPVAVVAALNNLALVDRDQGLLDDALTLTERARLLCATLGDRHREAALANNAADLLHALGRHDEAMVRLKEAVAIFAEVGDAGELEPAIWKLRDW